MLMSLSYNRNQDSAELRRWKLTYVSLTSLGA